ncbi:class I SAM-dependent methyltransferase [Nocardioides jiangxiensis]|uniref:Methyltransferase domain-containing protein n=1 Tax=Nocardioides jiangxiensis TaxID=3064524 RepID=A0ABT9AY93_9ACTN|nr:class I SAM-dependent methyltransferase [Nocardioides sp. WY-20]MDO7867544.1 methyltransferase domain-containing protein [Nocardioides sp. WY-20]
MGHVDEEMHRDRGRAESFGAAAAEYERYRPSYPPELVADLLARRPRRVLDVGAGTGKASRLLAGEGRTVLGVEPDPAMAAVARSLGVDVEVDALEGWDPQGRTFDLVVSGQAWHWVDPGAGAAKVAEVLVPGGIFVPFWNHTLPHPLHEVVEELQARLAPGRDFGVVDVVATERPYAAGLEESGRFATVATRRYAWTETLSAADWVGRLATRSDYLRLPVETRQELLAAIEERVAADEPLVLPFGTYAIFATTPS